MKTFSCGCHEWIIWTKDLEHDGEIANTMGYSQEHDCEKLTVYQERGGIKRIYVHKYHEPHT